MSTTREQVDAVVDSYAEGQREIGFADGSSSRDEEIVNLSRTLQAVASDREKIQEDREKIRQDLATLQALYDQHMLSHAPLNEPVTGTREFEDLKGLLLSDSRLPQDESLYVKCPQDVALEDFFGRMQDHQILFLPRDTRAWIETSEGFRAAGVGAVLGKENKRLPVVSTYKGKQARTWFAMARARKGVVGLGSTSQLLFDDSPWKMEAQIEDKGSPIAGGGLSPGRFYYNAKGEQVRELVGAMEKIIESVANDAVFANFAMPNVRDLGGIAFSAISLTKGGYVSRVNLDGAWRGFSGSPNGETAAVNIGGGKYLISRIRNSPLDKTGKRVGSSPIMVNNSQGGRWEFGESSMPTAGMPTIWRSSGRHEFFEVISRWGGPGVNIEIPLDGFEFVWEKGICWPNYRNNGGNPAPDGRSGGTSLHVAIGNAQGRLSVELKDVAIDRGPKADSLCVQLYNGGDPKKMTVKASDNGKNIPVTAYGAGGVVALAS